MELCWYKTSWTSGCLWLDNMQQTLIGDLFFFSPPWEAWKKTRKAAYFASSIYHPPRIGHWNPPQHRLNSAPFILHTTSSDWWDESCWSQELTYGSSRCQTQALLLCLRHYQALRLDLTRWLFIDKMSHKPVPYHHPSLFCSPSYSPGISCSWCVPFWEAAIKIESDISAEVFK